MSVEVRKIHSFRCLIEKDNLDAPLTKKKPQTLLLYSSVQMRNIMMFRTFR